MVRFSAMKRTHFFVPTEGELGHRCLKLVNFGLLLNTGSVDALDTVDFRPIFAYETSDSVKLVNSLHAIFHAG